MDRRKFLGAGASLVAGATLFERAAFAQQTTSRSRPAAPAASTIRSAAAWRTC